MQPLWKTVWRFLKNLKIEPPYAGNSTLGYVSWEKKQTKNTWKKYMHLNVHSSIIYSCQNRKATQVSINRWRIKMWYIMYVLSRFPRVWPFVTPWTVAHQAPLSMGFSRQQCWSGLLCPPLGHLLDPGEEPASLKSTCIGRWVLYH